MNTKSKIILNMEVTADEPVAVGPIGYGYETMLNKGDSKTTKVVGLPRFGRPFSHETPRYLQASTMRHILRESASLFVARALSDAGKPLPTPSVMALVSGYTETAGKKANTTELKGLRTRMASTVAPGAAVAAFGANPNTN